MAYCKHLSYLQVVTTTEFDDLHGSGSPAPLAGVYRCESCGVSTVRHNRELLPADHRCHGTPPLWRLIVRSHLG